jgi:hypothetical protein
MSTTTPTSCRALTLVGIAWDPFFEDVSEILRWVHLQPVRLQYLLQVSFVAMIELCSLSNLAGSCSLMKLTDAPDHTVASVSPNRN